jgi:hypothetical protein
MLKKGDVFEAAGKTKEALAAFLDVEMKSANDAATLVKIA